MKNETAEEREARWARDEAERKRLGMLQFEAQMLEMNDRHAEHLALMTYRREVLILTGQQNEALNRIADALAELKVTK